MYLDDYRKKMFANGENRREQLLNRTKSKILAKSVNSLSLKRVKLNGEDANLIVDSDDNRRDIKVIKSLPNESFETGDYVEWQDRHWIVITADVDDELYVDGKMQECNWQFTWLDKETREVCRYWACIENATQYNSGQTFANGGKITYPSAQFSIVMPCNKDTVNIDHGLRVVLDRNMKNPSVFRVSQNDTVDNSYGKGLLNIMAVENVYNEKTDKLIDIDGEKVWVADYVKDESSAPVNGIHADIDGLNYIVVGKSRTYKAIFKDENENILEDINYTWRLTPRFDGISEEKLPDGRLKLSASGESLIGSQFDLEVIVNDEVLSKLGIKVKDFL